MHSSTVSCTRSRAEVVAIGSTWAYMVPVLFAVVVPTLVARPVSMMTTASAFPANITEIIRSYGYPAEDYRVTTSDGFILSITRIPHGVSDVGRLANSSKPVVFLQHGLGGCSVDWVLNLPNESLAFILADAGYDVWMGNNRGTRYASQNIYWTPKQKEYWDWSFTEMCEIDMPLQVGFVLQQTGAPSLAYVGHSQGTIQAFCGLADPALAKQVNVFLALAPVAYLSHVRSLLIQALARVRTDELFELLGVHEFNPTGAMQKLLPGFCEMFPQLCEDVLGLYGGFDTGSLNKSRADFYLTYEPNPVSVKSMAHLAQEVRSGQFAQFDYGPAGNMQHYNQSTPPAYDLTRVHTPTALFVGGEDDLADVQDVDRAVALLPRMVLFHDEDRYNHFDPILALSAAQRVYPAIVSLVRQYAP